MEIPITGPDKHPILMRVAKNDQMKAYDLHVFVGNFKSEADAVAYANRIKEFLEENAGGEIGRVQ